MRTPRAVLLDLDETILTFGRRTDQIRRTVEARLGDVAVAPSRVVDVVEAEFAAFWADAERQTAWRTRVAEARQMIVETAFANLAAEGVRGLGRAEAHAFADSLQALRNAELAPFPGALEAVDALRAAGFRLALVTNGAARIQRAKIERFDLESRFDHLQIEGEAGFGKPDPRAYLHALEALGARPPEAWMVGDNLEWEVAAPKRLGIYSVWCDPHRAGLPEDAPAHPDRIVHDLREVAAALGAAPAPTR